MIDKTILNRSLSLIVCLFWFCVVWIDRSFTTALGVIPAFMFVLSFIWFGDYLGQRMGLMGFGGSLTNVDTKTPGWIVALGGWFFLLAIPIIAWLVSD